MQFLDGFDSKCASNFAQNVGNIATETLVMIIQAYDEENMSRTREFEWEIPK
jgi:hypothetical protein